MTMGGSKNRPKYKINDIASAIFAAIILGSFMWWIIQLFCEGIDSVQYSLFFQRLNDLFADTLNVIGYTSGRDPYYSELNHPREHGYPPLAYLVYYPLSKITNLNDSPLSFYKQPPLLIVFFIIMILFMIFLFYTLYRGLNNLSELPRFLLALSICMSFPLLYTLERANDLLLALLFTTLFLFLYNSENKALREVAYISLAVAAGLKITPAVFGILLIYKKRWFDSIRCVIYGIIISIAPFFFFQRSISENVVKMIQNIQYNLDWYSDIEGCSPIAAIFQIGQVFYGEDFYFSENEHTILRLLTIVIAAILLLIAPILKSEWETVLAVTIASIILPSHSGAYNIIYYIPVTIMLFNKFENRVWYYITALAFIPMYWVHVDEKYKKLYYGSTPLLIIIMLTLGAIAIYNWIIKLRIDQKT